MLIVYSGDEVESQCEPSGSVAVGATKDAEAFDVAENVFTLDAQGGQALVLLFLQRGERVVFGVFVRGVTLLVPLGQTLIPRIGQDPRRRAKPQARGFKEGKVVCGTRGKGGGQNRSCGFFNQDLSFDGVALFLAGVEPRLFFLRWGRCTGTSVASSNTRAFFNAGECNAFLPGKANRPQASKASSTFRTMRHAVVSLTP